MCEWVEIYLNFFFLSIFNFDQEAEGEFAFYLIVMGSGLGVCEVAPSNFLSLSVSAQGSFSFPSAPSASACGA